MKHFFLGLAAAGLGALTALLGIALYEARREEECHMAEVHAFAVEACVTGKQSVLCVLTPADIVDLNRSADILKSCAKELKK